MRSILTVSVVAASTRLTTLETVKTALGITDDANDVQIDDQIERVSAEIAKYIGVRAGADGNVTLGRETVVETFRGVCAAEVLLLSRFPVSSLTSVVADGTTLAGTDYELDAATGMLYRLSGDHRCHWYGTKIVFTYVAGWLLPEDGTNRNLPQDIEDAAIAAIAASNSMRGRDPMLRSETVVGVGSQEYAVSGPGEGSTALPYSATSLLDRHRRYYIG